MFDPHLTAVHATLKGALQDVGESVLEHETTADLALRIRALLSPKRPSGAPVFRVLDGGGEGSTEDEAEGLTELQANIVDAIDRNLSIVTDVDGIILAYWSTLLLRDRQTGATTAVRTYISDPSLPPQTEVGFLECAKLTALQGLASRNRDL